MKRFLAGLLCTTMIFTELFSATVFASEINYLSEAEEYLSVSEETDTQDEIMELSQDEALEAGDAEAESVEFDASVQNEEADTDDSEVQSEEDILGETLIPATCFTISENGILRLKPDGVIPNYTVIPRWIDLNGDRVETADEIVHIIPEDLFKGNVEIQQVRFMEDSEISTIEAHAFEGCKDLQLIGLPVPHKSKFDSQVYKITEIKDGTFKNCIALKTVAVNNTELEKIGKEAFFNTAVDSFYSPVTLTEISDYAFSNCKSLMVLELNRVIKVGERAFDNCTSLGSVAGNVAFTEYQEVLGDYAFENCGFTSLNMTNATGLKSIGVALFKDCAQMTSFIFPERNKGGVCISDEMFSGCKKLATVTIDNEFGATVGENAFKGCSALTKIVLPSSFSVIKTKAFNGCTSLKSVEIKNPNIDVRKVADDAFDRPGVKGFTIYGYTADLETYAKARGFNYVDKNLPRSVNYSFGSNATITQSPTGSHKPGDEVIISVKLASGYTLLPDENGRQIINGTVKNTKKNTTRNVDSEMKLQLVSVAGSVVKFRYIVPWFDDDESFTIKGNVNKPQVADERELKASVPNDTVPGLTMPNVATPAGCFDEITNKINFKQSGQQAAILIRNSKGLRMGPWRFKFESSNPDVVTVTPEGVITARSQVGKVAYVTAKLLSNQNVEVAIPVEIGKLAAVNQIDFKFSSTDFGLPAYVEQGPDVTRYEMITHKDSDGNEYQVRESRTYKVITVPKYLINTKAVTFTVEAEPKDSTSPDSVFFVNTKWSSYDTTVAKVKSSNSTNNRNQVEIQKGASGETEIKVKVVNEQYEENDERRICEYGFIIRVENHVPRGVAYSLFNVNTCSQKGTKLPVVVGYDGKYRLQNHEFWISKSKDGQKDKNSNDFEVNYYENPEKPDDVAQHIFYGDYYLKVTEKLAPKIAKGKSKTYTGLYLCGQIYDRENLPNNGFFAIPLGPVVVENKPFETKVTLTGTINTFYNARLDDVRHTKTKKVTLTQKLKEEQVEEYKFVTDYHHSLIKAGRMKVSELQSISKNAVDEKGYSTYDELQANFMFGNISLIDGSVEIYRTPTDVLERDKTTDKEVTSGYLYIKYKNYEDYVIAPVTIPVKKAKPSYALNISSITTNVFQGGMVYDLMLVDPKTKKLPLVDLLDSNEKPLKDDKGVTQRAYVDLLGETGDLPTDKATFEYDYKTTGAFDTTVTTLRDYAPEYKDPNNSAKNEPATKKYASIPLTIKYPEAGKAYINVKLYNWTEPIKYTFNLKATNKVATVKASAGTVTMFTEVTTVSPEIKLTLNQDYAKLIAEDITTDVNGANNNIKLVMTPDPKKPYECKVSVKATGALTKGKYKYEIAPKAEYTTATKETNKIRITVVVSEAKPEIKLASTTFNLNSRYTGTEMYAIKYSLKNLPIGDHEFEVANSKIIRNGVSANRITYSKIECLNEKHIDGIEDHITLELGKSKNEPDAKFDQIKVGFIGDDSTFREEKFNYKFEVSGLKIKDAKGNEISLSKPLVFKVSSKPSDVTVKQSAKGYISPINPKSCIVYTASVKNIASPKIHYVACNEVYSVGNTHVVVKPEEQHFNLRAVTQSDYDDLKMDNITVDKYGKIVDNQYMLTWNGRNEFKKGETYYVILDYKIDGVIDPFTNELKIFKSSPLKVTIKQAIPAVYVEFAEPSTADSKKMAVDLYEGSAEKQQSIIRVMPRNYIWTKVDKISLACNADESVRQAFGTQCFKVEAPKGDTLRETISLRRVATNYRVVEIIDGTEVEVTDAVTKLHYQNLECDYYKGFVNNDSYEKKDGHYYAVVKVTNPAKVVKRKDLKFDVEIKYVNQMKKTTGTKFTMKVNLFR